jgi:hypothetical protein
MLSSKLEVQPSLAFLYPLARDSLERVLASWTGATETH